jgi:hypothetical protein
LQTKPLTPIAKTRLTNPALSCNAEINQATGNHPVAFSLLGANIMASAAQVEANRANAQLSTGPKSPEGKAAVAQNRATHGLAGRDFFLLPDEDPAEFEALSASYSEEHQPAGPTESFLVRELVRSEWKLRRVSAIEAGLLSGDADTDFCLVKVFQAGMPSDHALLKLARYENTIRRNWFRAHAELRALRRENTRAVSAEALMEKNAFNQAVARLEEQLTIPERQTSATPPAPAAAPPPLPGPPSPAVVNDSKPMPVHLERELAAHKRRDPLFDPIMDASQMSKELRRWFERFGPKAA